MVLKYLINIILEIIVISDSAAEKLTLTAHLLKRGNCCVGGE